MYQRGFSHHIQKVIRRNVPLMTFLEAAFLTEGQESKYREGLQSMVVVEYNDRQPQGGICISSREGFGGSRDPRRVTALQCSPGP